MYVWYLATATMVNTPANISVSQLKGLHNTSLLEIIFSDHLELLSPAQLVFSLFLAGLI